MNCLSQRVRRSKETFSRREYEERLAALTPEERRRREQQGKETFDRVFGTRHVMEALNVASYITGGIYLNE